MRRLFGRRDATLALIIAALLCAIVWRAPVFASAGNLDTVINDGAILTIMALAQMHALVARGVDLSVGAVMALAGMLAALLSRAHPELPALLALGLAGGSGLVLGAANGALIAGLGMPPIVVTLGTLSVYRGLVFVISDGAWVNAHELGQSFLSFPHERLLGLTHLTWIALAVVAASYLFLHHRRAGRELFALGGNPAAARAVGIDVARRELLVYTITGTLAGLSGYLWVARYAVAYTETALGFEMQTIAACVIGGVSIRGGRGGVVGCLLGSAFLVILFNALPVIDVSPFWQMAISGATILAAVVLNARSERRRLAARRILPVAGVPAASRAT
ncbi:MAG TPA: ABC transporter permease [Polyangiaceae bacterium]|nr:ABC transporter permease [Polyangiaceae bacterium]